MKELDDLKDAYIAELPEKVRAIEQEITATCATLRKKQNPKTENLLLLVHRLAGSAGTYGMLALSEASRELENLIIENNLDVAYLEEWLKTFKQSVDQAIVDAKDKNGRMVA